MLYLLHGYPYDETEWATLGLDLTVAGSVLSGEWPPFLVVMPRVPDPLYRSTDGGPGSYEEEMVDGLVSFIDLTFQTDPRPERRAIAGISRGGCGRSRSDSTTRMCSRRWPPSVRRSR